MTSLTGEPLIVQARWDFQKNGRDFDRDREWTERKGGYYFSTPEYLMFGWASGPEEIEGAPGPFWLIFYARVVKGYNVGSLFDQMPYELPWIGFMRGMQGKKDLKYYPREHLHKLCKMSGNYTAG